MLVLALERATDGHDSLDCQMALENIQNTNLKQVTAFRKYHLTKRNHDHEKTSQKKRAFLLTVTLLVHYPVLYIKKPSADNLLCVNY